MDTVKIEVYDNLNYDKFLNILQYFCNFTSFVNIHLSKDNMYIQVINKHNTILFELNIPSYWFSDYYFNYLDNVILTVKICEFYKTLHNFYPAYPISIIYDITKPSIITINNIIIENHICIVGEPLLILPNNYNYQYHLVIEQSNFQQYINYNINNNENELYFHCSSKLNQVIIYNSTNNNNVILEDYNSTRTSKENFILKFNTYLISQLPFNIIQCTVIYIFLNPNEPIKISFPLDESDDLIDFCIYISPNEVYNTVNDDFLEMCSAMKNTSI
jgi:hypothetical protein